MAAFLREGGYMFLPPDMTKAEIADWNARGRPVDYDIATTCLRPVRAAIELAPGIDSAKYREAPGIDAWIAKNPIVTEKEKPGMNHSLAVFLISDAVRAVLCTYDPEPERNKSEVTRTLFKTFNQDIAVGDYVVVPTDTRHKMTVVKVVEVDVEPDFDSGQDFDWIVGVVDRASFEEIERQEAAAIEKVKSAERRKKRDELGAALATDEAALKELKALPLATHGEPVEPPPSTKPE